MFKRMIAFMKGLAKSPVFRRTIVHFLALVVLAGGFVALTNSEHFARSTVQEVPAQYKGLRPMFAVDLEQALRTRPQDVEGLVLFNGIKSVVVLGRGFDNDNLVSEADIDVMQDLAKANGKPVTFENPVVVPVVDVMYKWIYWTLVAVLVIGVFKFLFGSRKKDGIPCRFVVGWTACYKTLQATIKKTKLRRWRFYGLVTIGLWIIVAVIFTTQVFNDKNMVVLPSDFSAADRAQPYQVERQLQAHPETFSRVSFAPSVNAVYVVLNTSPSAAKLEALKAEQARADSAADAIDAGSSEVAPIAVAPGFRGPRAGPAPAAKPVPGRDGVSSIARTVVYPATAEGTKAYRHFADNIRARGIDNKEAPKVVATEFFETVYMPARVFSSFCGLLSLLTLLLTISAMTDSKESEDEGGGTQNLVIAGASGEAAPIGNVTAQSLKTFADVAGCDEAIETCKLVVKKLRFPMIYKAFGAPVPKGIIFYGAPGNGKTLLARAMAGETGGGFIAVSGSAFVKLYVGVGAATVRERFNEARELAKKTGKPTFLFIDEFDAIGKRRGQGESGSNSEQEQTLNELLVQMDGFANDGKVIVIAATNRLDVLDEAVLRSGRFDIKIEIKKPDRKGRADIFKVYLRNRKFTLDEVSPSEHELALTKIIGDCAIRSGDFSGADIELTVKEASTIAAERHYDEMKEMSEEEMKERAVLLPSDLQAALDLVSYGRTMKSRVRSAKERKATSVHEIGHAAIPTLLGGDAVTRITIVMTDKSLGLMESGSDEDRYGWDKKEFLLRIKTMLAGRAAEERIADSCSTGASNDFERASLLARQMVGMFGMSEEFGVRTIPLDRNGLPVGQIGNALMEIFTSAWSRIVQECQTEVCQLIDDNRERIIRAADLLFEEEVLSGERFREVWNAEVESANAATDTTPVAETASQADGATTVEGDA